MFFNVYLSHGTPFCRLAAKSLQGFNGMLMRVHGREKSVEGYLVFINILCPQKSCCNLGGQCLMYLLCSCTLA